MDSVDLGYTCSVSIGDIHRSFEMAGVNTQVSLDVLERQWVQKSIATQINVLSRSRLKEMAGSPIWELRGKELEQLRALAAKVA